MLVEVEKRTFNIQAEGKVGCIRRNTVFIRHFLLLVILFTSYVQIPASEPGSVLLVFIPVQSKASVMSPNRTLERFLSLHVTARLAFLLWGGQLKERIFLFRYLYQDYLSQKLCRMTN